MLSEAQYEWTMKSRCRGWPAASPSNKQSHSAGDSVAAAFLDPPQWNQEKGGQAFSSRKKAAIRREGKNELLGIMKIQDNLTQNRS